MVFQKIIHMKQNKRISLNLEIRFVNPEIRFLNLEVRLGKSRDSIFWTLRFDFESWDSIFEPWGSNWWIRRFNFLNPEVQFWIWRFNFWTLRFDFESWDSIFEPWGSTWWIRRFNFWTLRFDFESWDSIFWTLRFDLWIRRFNFWTLRFNFESGDSILNLSSSGYNPRGVVLSPSNLGVRTKRLQEEKNALSPPLVLGKNE